MSVFKINQDILNFNFKSLQKQIFYTENPIPNSFYYCIIVHYCYLIKIKPNAHTKSNIETLSSFKFRDTPQFEPYKF